MSRTVICILALALACETVSVHAQDAADTPTRGYSIPTIDLDREHHRQVIIDRENGQYLGHPTTVLLKDGRTMLCVYPQGHGRGPIVCKRSTDGGLTWSQRLPVPESWATSKETPTIYRVIDKQGTERLILFSGLYPIRMSVSEDDGRTWTELSPIGDFGGIVAMSSVERLANGDYVALFHDDGRFFRNGGQSDGVMRLYQVISRDGGLTWSEPEMIHDSSEIHLCEPGIVRSPDGKTLAILLRENKRQRNSHVMFSTDEAKTWSKPRALPGALTGDRHTARYAADGRLFISFRDTTLESDTHGDWVGWVGTWDDIVHGGEGEYRVRLKDNKHRWDCAYPGVEVLPDGSIVTTTYGHWDHDEDPYVICVRFTLDELDRKLSRQRSGEAEPESTDILYCTQSLGYRHPVLPESRRIIASLDHEHDDLSIAITNDVTSVSQEQLEAHDVLFLYTTGPLALDMSALRSWIERGGALVGVHSATDTLKEDPQYINIIGGLFDGHPWNEQVTIIVDQPDHPAMKPWLGNFTGERARFQIADEIYQFKSINPEMNVLMRLDPDTPRAEPRRAYPLCWTLEFGQGRVFYSALGHRPSVWRMPEYQEHVLAAIRWAARR